MNIETRNPTSKTVQFEARTTNDNEQRKCSRKLAAWKGKYSKREYSPEC